MEQCVSARRRWTECSETSEYKIQTPGNYPEESMHHTEHVESLKSRSLYRYAQRIDKKVMNFYLR